MRRWRPVKLTSIIRGLIRFVTESLIPSHEDDRGMHNLRIAASAHCFDQPLRQLIQSAAEMGVQGLQFDARNELKASELSGTGRRQLLHYLTELDLSVASLTFPTRRSFYDQDQLDGRIAATKAAMEFAFQMNARILTARIGKIPSDAESPEYAVLCDVLNGLARYGNRIGTTLCVTPTNDSPDVLKQLLSRIVDGLIGINYDPATFVLTGHDPIDAFRELHDVIHHIQVRDALRDIDGSGIEVPVGRGEVPWDELLAMIDESKYLGWLTVDRTTGDDKLTDITRAANFLRNVAMG